MIKQHHRLSNAIDIAFLILFGILYFVLPWSYEQASLRNTGIVLLIYTFFILKDRSWLLMLPLMFFIIPQQLNDENSSVEIIAYSKYFKWFCSIVILLSLLFNFGIIKRQKGILSTFACIFFLLFISLYYAMEISGDKDDIMFIVYFFVLYYFFYVIVKDRSLSYKYFYYAFDILFYFLSFYAVQEFFFHVSPYDDLYYAYTGTNYYDAISFLRVKSLCGHPLLFCAFLVVYQISLYARLIYTRSKIVYIHFLVMIFVSLLTLSRTIFVIEIAVFLIYYILQKKYFPHKHSHILLILTLLAFIGAFIFYDLIMLSLERFSDSDVSETNRLSAFQVSWTIFQNEPLGVGDNLTEMYKKYHRLFPSGFTVDVLDNGFLAIICMYGIFSPFFLLPFFYPMIDTYRNVKSDVSCRMLFWLTVFSFLLLSFSFIIIKYPSILMLMAVNFAIINQIYHGRISNNCKL